MTPKKKAKRLNALYKSYLPSSLEPDLFKALGKKFALLCVDEILDTKPLEKGFEDHGHLGREVWYKDKTDYWLSVKHELSLL